MWSPICLLRWHVDHADSDGVPQDASTTVLAFQCTGSNVDTSVCGTVSQTVTYGTTTYMAAETAGNLGVTLDCSIATDSASALCTGEIAAPAAIFTDPSLQLSEISSLDTASGVQMSSTTVSVTLDSAEFTFLPVTVTAGQDKLSSASASASSGSASGNGAGSLQAEVAVSGLMAGFLGMVMMM